MRVAIVTSNESVMVNVVSMAAKNGCKFTKIKKYSLEQVKGHDYCIFDLDNLKDSWDTIKQDVQNMGEMVILGITRSDDVADMFRPAMNIEKKPFLVNTFIEYKKQVHEKAESDYVINKDAERIYTALGVKVSDLLDEQVLSDSDRLQLLSDKIETSKTPIQKEDEFFKKIGVDDIAVPEPIVITPNTAEKVNIFEDNALLMFRTRKLRSLNLSVAEIEERLRLLNERSHVKSQTRTSSMSSDIANKLKSGYFSRKNRPGMAPAVPEFKPKAELPSQPKQDPIPSVEEIKREIKPPEEKKPKEIPSVKDNVSKPSESKDSDIKIEEQVESDSQEISDFEKQYLTNNEEKPSVPEEVELPKETPDLPKADLEPKKEIHDRKPIIPPKKNNDVLDVKLSPEMEEKLNAQLARLKNMRKPTAPKRDAPAVQDEAEDKEPEPLVPDIDHDDYGLDKAISRLGGHKPNEVNKTVSPTVKSSSEERLVKKMPTTSLFDLIKGRVSSHPKDDTEERKKASIEKIIKPPER